jgi:hypothetical protein
MTYCLPDTNIVIGRARNVDIRHKTANKALFKYLNSDIRILKIVYLEAIEVLNRKYNKVKTEIDFAKRSVAEKRRVNPAFIGLKDLDEVIKEATPHVDQETATYFQTMVAQMKRMARQKMDPFQGGSYVVDLAIDYDIGLINGIFMIDGLGGCIDSDERHRDKRKELMAQFKLLNEFFEDEYHSKDREIAVEAVLQAWEVLEKKVDFITDDYQFSTNFGVVLPLVSAKVSRDHTLVNVIHAPTVQ